MFSNKLDKIARTVGSNTPKNRWPYTRQAQTQPFYSVPVLAPCVPLAGQLHGLHHWLPYEQTPGTAPRTPTPTTKLHESGVGQRFQTPLEIQWVQEKLHRYVFIWSLRYFQNPLWIKPENPGTASSSPTGPPLLREDISLQNKFSNKSQVGTTTEFDQIMTSLLIRLLEHSNQEMFSQVESAF